MHAMHESKKPEFRFLLNGVVIPEIRISRKCVNGEATGSLQIEVRDEVIGWMTLDDNSHLCDKDLPRFEMSYRNETEWAKLSVCERHADPDHGWRKTSDRKLLKILETAGYIETKKDSMSTDDKRGTRVCKPRVGIFWLFDEKLLVEGTPVSEAEPYANHLGHPAGHPAVWERWQKLGSVPKDVPYDEPPRGRVMFNRIDGTYVLLADKCILNQKGIVSMILRALDLPKTVTVDTDGHYRCHVCLYGDDTDEDWGE